MNQIDVDSQPNTGSIAKPLTHNVNEREDIFCKEREEEPWVEVTRKARRSRKLPTVHEEEKEEENLDWECVSEEEEKESFRFKYFRHRGGRKNHKENKRVNYLKTIGRKMKNIEKRAHSTKEVNAFVEITGTNPFLMGIGSFFRKLRSWKNFSSKEVNGKSDNKRSRKGKGSRKRDPIRHVHEHNHKNEKKVPPIPEESPEEFEKRTASIPVGNWSDSDDDESSNQSSGPRHIPTENTPEDALRDQSFGPRIMEALGSLKETLGFVDPDWLSCLESLLVLSYQLYRAETFADVVFAAIAYMKGVTTGSVIHKILKVIGLSESGGKEVNGLADDIAVCLNDWQHFRSHEIFPKISYLISASVSLASCKEASIDWSIPGFQNIAEPLKDEQVKAIDVVDAVLRTFSWCLETGNACLNEKSLSPILYSDQSVRKYDTLVSEVIALSSQYLAGNKKDLDDYESRVLEAIRTTARMKAIKPTGPMGALLQSKYALLIDIRERIILRRKESSIRYAPFGIHISGNTNVGKSTLTKLAYKVVLEAMGEKFDKNRVGTDDNFDDYDTAMHSDLLVFILDDLNQGKAEFQRRNPIERIIKFFNNVAARAVKAELNEKGVTFIEFKVGVITSNHKDFGARYYTDVPEAVLRRFYHTRVHVKEKFRVPGGVSLDTNHPDLAENKLRQDVWELDIEECFVYTGSSGKTEYKFRTMVAPPDFEGPRIWKGLTCKQWLQAHVYLAKRHDKLQKALLSDCNEFDDMEMCKTCCLPDWYCTCPKCDHRDIEAGLEDDSDEELTFKDEYELEERAAKVRAIMKNREQYSKEQREKEISDEEESLPSDDDEEEERSNKEVNALQVDIVLDQSTEKGRDRMELTHGKCYLDCLWKTAKGHYRRRLDLLFSQPGFYDEMVRLMKKMETTPIGIVRGDRIIFGRNGKERHIYICSNNFPIFCELLKVCRRRTFPSYLIPRDPNADAFRAASILHNMKHKQVNALSADWVPTENIQNMMYNVFMGAAKRVVRETFQPIISLNWWTQFTPVKYMATRVLMKDLADDVLMQVTPTFMSFVPSWLCNSRAGTRIINYWCHSRTLQELGKRLKYYRYGAYGGLILSAITRSYHGAVTTGALSLMMSALTYRAYVERYKLSQQEFVSRQDSIIAGTEEIKQSFPKYTLIAGGILVGVKLLHTAWLTSRASGSSSVSEFFGKTPNSGKTAIELEETLNKDTSPGWQGNIMQKFGSWFERSPPTNSTTDQLVESFSKSNLFWTEFQDEDDFVTRCGESALEDKIGLIPFHVFCKNGKSREAGGALRAKAQRNTSLNSVKYGHFRLGYNAFKLPDKDMVMVHMPDLQVKNRVDLLPKSRPTGSGVGKLVSCVRNQIKVETVSYEFAETGSNFSTFYGLDYKLSDGVGKCMSPIIDISSNPAIVGFHICADPKTKEASAISLTYDEYMRAREEFVKLPSVIMSAKESKIPKQYNKDLIVSSSIHPQSAFARMEPNAAVVVHGSTRLRTTQKSCVIKSPLSDTVAQVTGVENKWGPPKMTPNWRAFNATLEHVVNPPLPFDPALLEKAALDYVKDIIELAKTNKDPHCRVLTDEEAVKGIDGVRFIDAIKRATGAGSPLMGKKNKYIDENFVVDAIIWTEIQRILSCWKKGERAYPMYNACLKDEPTKLDKDKVRVFEGCPVAFSILIRKYFLGLCRFLSLHPLTTECAVGLNATSKEWQVMMEYVESFSKSEFLAWDYSKYDVRMHCEIITTVFKVLLHIAQNLKCDGKQVYTNADLSIMEMMISDLRHPFIDWNGTAITALNMNPSGNPLTVYINSIAGALYARMGFFHVYPTAPPYRQCVHSITYGDDYKGTIDPKYRDFNFRSYKEFLEKHSVKITVPSKTDEVVDFISAEDADFLKRHSVYIPEIDCTVGALDIMSIYKSWHCNLRGNEPPLLVAMNCLEQGIHEAFFHGRAVFERVLGEATEICQIHGVHMPCLSKTFDDRVEFWLSKST